MSKVLVVLATVVLALLGATAARADADFTDPAGDAGAAPDVTDVSVFNDSLNRVVFGARLAGGKAMASNGEIAFIVDADKNVATGSDGWDYVVVIAGDKTAYVLRWDGAQWADAPATTVKPYFIDDVVMVGIDRSELGSTSAFDFFAEASTVVDGQATATDSVPDGDGVWSYATVTKSFGLDASPLVAVTKGGARAGKSFVAGYVFGRTDSPEPAAGAKSTCTATLAGKKVAARVVQQDDVAACRLTLPKTAKGKLLKLTVTTTLTGKVVKRSYATKVR